MSKAEEKLFKAFEKTFEVKPQNIYDVINLQSDEFLDLIENLLFLEEEFAKQRVLEALEENKNDHRRIWINGYLAGESNPPLKMLGSIYAEADHYYTQKFGTKPK